MAKGKIQTMNDLVNNINNHNNYNGFNILKLTVFQELEKCHYFLKYLHMVYICI